MSESSFDVLRDLVEDPKDNGDYELHLKGEELERLYKACERESERKAEPMIDSKLKSACERAGNEIKLLVSDLEKEADWAADFPNFQDAVQRIIESELSPLFAEITPDEKSLVESVKSLQAQLQSERTAREAAESRVKELESQLFQLEHGKYGLRHSGEQLIAKDAEIYKLQKVAREAKWLIDNIGFSGYQTIEWSERKEAFTQSVKEAGI